MKILCFIHAYPPDHNAGAEWMLHAINKYLIGCGHEVKVMVRGGDHVTCKNGKNFFRKLSYINNLDGVEIYYEGITMYNKLFPWADIVLTHLDMTGKAMNLCRAFERKLVHLIHNTHYNDVVVRINPRNSYMIYNSEWVKDTLKYPQESYVLHPPVEDKDYRIKPTGKAITLVNCYQKKGGDILIELAKALPDRKFIGVMGYGNQEMGNSDNLTYLENTPDILSVYKQSRIVVMPSTYESYGRVAIEASASGIPVIVTDTPGLREALDYAGVFIKNRDDISEWVEAIESLDDAEIYKKTGALGKKRAKELTLQSSKDLKGLEEFLLTVAKKRYHHV